MRSAILILLLILFVPYISANNDIGHLLTELDHILEESGKYVQQKENRLNRLKNHLNTEISPENQFETCFNIIEEYKSYQSDSALAYIYKNLHLAESIKNKNWEIRTKLQYSFVLSFSGLFIEAEELLKSISYEDLAEDLYVDYYMSYNKLYSNLETYNSGNIFASIYNNFARNYRDTLLNLLPEDSYDRFYFLYKKALEDNDYDKAMHYLKIQIRIVPQYTHQFARTNYTLSELYRRMDDTPSRLFHLIEAVKSDVMDAVKENMALLDLALYLYEQKDMKRAYHYAQYALNDANIYNARFRYIKIARKLPIITTAFQQYTNQQNTWLKRLLVSTSFLSVILFFALFFLYKQKKALSLARRKLKHSNRNLNRLNKKLNHLNIELTEANHVKEKYVGYFIDLCSEYINKMESYLKLINNKIAAKRFDDLSKLTSSNGNIADEVKELYNNFDKAFLNIYPKFVSSFNQLLKKDDQFILKKGELLNTELRVFALIRLGFTDSAKISAFLRCSIQTVYNYRSKIKRKTINGEDVEEKIMQIGNKRQGNDKAVLFGPV